MTEDTDEQQLKQMVAEVTGYNKKVDDAYDERLRRLEAKKKLKIDEKGDEENDKRIALLNEKLLDFKGRVSQSRKSGKDPFFADMALRNVPAKITIAKFSREKKDFDAVDDLFKLAEKELAEAEGVVEINLKKEMQQKVEEDRKARQAAPIEVVPKPTA